ncbi:putative Tau-tubulin kinase 1 [Blattamonas nauphoetae]|uniref:non-specific serine/threonine protein kinase n=1 Tax=Blattamonas nauphoetae TaxID=2049346 RepID=A0ABQ9Y635_9EUKA|nr:putative Tau-tubulin kinase 1 [Blattamonas nauphoetae]
MAGCPACAKLKVGSVINKKYIIQKRLGQGAFGVLYVASFIDEDQPVEVALKFEQKCESRTFLFADYYALKRLSGKPHFSHLYDFGKENDYFYLAMELLGPSLLDLVNQQKKWHFKIPTIIGIGLQCVEALKILHEEGIVHRDIKPANLLIGKTGKDRHTIYLIDFGLVKQLLTKEAMDKPVHKNVHFRGTYRYCSLNGHAGKELGRHDDLISLLYVLCELGASGLPWSSITDKEDIYTLKKKHQNASLFGAFPPQFQQIYDYLIGLDYFDTPNYDYISSLFSVALSANSTNPNPLFDWEEPPQLLSLNTPPTVRSSPTNSIPNSTRRFSLPPSAFNTTHFNMINSPQPPLITIHPPNEAGVSKNENFMFQHSFQAPSPQLVAPRRHSMFARGNNMALRTPPIGPNLSPITTESNHSMTPSLGSPFLPRRLQPAILDQISGLHDTHTFFTTPSHTFSSVDSSFTLSQADFSFGSILSTPKNIPGGIPQFLNSPMDNAFFDLAQVVEEDLNCSEDKNDHWGDNLEEQSVQPYFSPSNPNPSAHTQSSLLLPLETDSRALTNQALLFRSFTSAPQVTPLQSPQGSYGPLNSNQITTSSFGSNFPINTHDSSAFTEFRLQPQDTPHAKGNSLFVVGSLSDLQPTPLIPSITQSVSSPLSPNVKSTSSLRQEEKRIPSPMSSTVPNFHNDNACGCTIL